MAKSKALMSFVLAGDDVDLGKAVASVNDELLRGGSDSLSVTIIIGDLDLSTGAVAIICAGHEDPITVTKTGECRSHRLDGGPPMGLVQYPYPLERLDLSPGDMLVLVTDGITEAQNQGGELFGRARILNRLAEHAENATAMCEAIRDSVRAFEAGSDPTDDLTVMALRYLGPSAA